tara:strand:+ start:321 stop:611 length:291 start_codon:yes stop_codon:yes gene_type:complete
MIENLKSSIPSGNMFPTEFTNAMINIDIIIMTEKKRNPFGETKVNAICYKSQYINTFYSNKPDVAMVSFCIYVFLPAFGLNAFAGSSAFLCGVPHE